MATVTTPTTPAGWSPDLVSFPPADTVGDAVVLQASTLVGSIEGDEPSVRCPFVSDDGSPGFVDEGAQIGDAEQAFSETVITTGKLATVGKYSFETLAQQNAAQLITQSLNRSIVTAADEAFLGNSSDPLGLLNTSGIVDGGSVGSNLDSVVDVVSGIEAAGGQATHVIAAPDAWATLSKLKTGTDSEMSLIGAGTTDAVRSLLGVPVLVTPAMPEASLLVLDNRAVLRAESPVRVARSDQAFFSSDVVAVRVAWRLGWSLQRPDRVAKLTTTTEE